jgi:hypothetical protein
MTGRRKMHFNKIELFVQIEFVRHASVGMVWIRIMLPEILFVQLCSQMVGTIKQTR